MSLRWAHSPIGASRVRPFKNWLGQPCVLACTHCELITMFGSIMPLLMMNAQNSTTAELVTKPTTPSLLPPSGTLALCLLTIGTAIAQSFWDGGRVAKGLGVAVGSLFSPSSLARIGEGQVIPAWLTLFTYVFPHGGWWHVLPNMTALWIFGAIAERVTGTWRFVGGYFVSGAVGAFCYALVLPNSIKPLAGASLAIAGIVGAYAAWRWSSQPHSGSQRLLAFTLEVVSVAGVMTWLAPRIVPVEPDLPTSVMYHFIPFLVMWFGVRAYSGCRRIM